MKAIIDENGFLTINPNGSLETYALNQWLKNYQNGDNSSGLVVNLAGVKENDK